MSGGTGDGPRIGVLTNPRSRHNRLAGVHALEPLLARYPRALHRVAASRDDIWAALAAFAALGVDVVAINGGDGTVHTVLDGLLDREIFDELPLLAVLPGGRTNMTANDVGVRGGSSRRALERLLAWNGSGDASADVTSRPVIRVEGDSGGRPRHGFFFGTAGLYQATVNCWAFREASRIPGMKTGLGTAVSIGRQLVGHLLRRGPIAPTPIGVQFDGEARTDGEYLMLIVTTLDRMALGLRPFWDDRPAPLRFTAVAFAHRHFLRAVPALLRGKPNGVLKPEHGYSSRNAHSVVLELASGCMLDGEIVQPRPHTPIHLTAKHTVRFLRP